MSATEIMEPPTAEEVEIMEDPELEHADGDADGDGSEGDDGDDAPGWVAVLATGKVQAFEHPEGITPKELMAKFVEAKQKGKSCFLVSETCFIDPQNTVTLGWSDDVFFPESEQLAGPREQIEDLVGALGQAAEAVNFLVEQQAALQQAQAGLFDAVNDEGTLEEDLEETRNPPAPAGKAKHRKGKKGFRVPGA